MTKDITVPFRRNRTLSIIFYTIMILGGFALAGAVEIAVTLIYPMIDFG
jgi:hypothetical protein